MLSGELIHEAIINVSDSELLCAFGSTFYHFHKPTQKCLKKIDVGHESPILHAVHHNDRIISVDERGMIRMFTIQGKIIVKGSLDQPPQRAIICGQQEPIIYYLKQGRLNIYRPETQHHQTICSQLLHQQFLYHDEKYIITSHENEVHIISNSEHLSTYSHSTPIISSTINFKDLIIGDQQGKIYILHGYLANRKAVKTKLQWHVGPVRCLQIVGTFLYSAGGESVIVMWHLTQMSKDFLPRVGTAIRSLQVVPITNEIICGLEDSSVKTILISNDKEIKTYRTIIKGTHTKRRVLTSYGDYICLNGNPGQLQFINLSTGSIFEFEIISRNLICGIDSHHPHPHAITNVSIGPSSMAVVVESTYPSYRYSFIKFYSHNLSYNQEIALINKTEHPHQEIVDCMNIGDTYITYGKDEEGVKIWQKVKKNKQSLVQSEEVYWGCKYEFNYHGLAPIHLHANNKNLILTYEGQIIILDVFKLEIVESVKVQNVLRSFLSHKNQLVVVLRDKTEIWNLQHKTIPLQLNSHSVKQVHCNNKCTIIYTKNYIIILKDEGLKCYEIEQFQRITLQHDHIVGVKNYDLWCISPQGKLIDPIKREHKPTQTKMEGQQMYQYESGLESIYDRYVCRHKPNIQVRSLPISMGVGLALGEMLI